MSQVKILRKNAEGKAFKVNGTATCHECGRPVRFDLMVGHGRFGLSSDTISCPSCNVELYVNAENDEKSHRVVLLNVTLGTAHRGAYIGPIEITLDRSSEYEVP